MLARRYPGLSVTEAMALGEKIGLESRPNDELAQRLTRVMAPFIEPEMTLESMQYLAAFAMNAWNTAFIPTEERAEFTKFALGSLTDDHAELQELTEDLLAVKEALYPDDMRFIGDCDVTQEGHRFIISASAGPDYMNGGEPDPHMPLGFAASNERDRAIADQIGKPIEEVSLEDVLAFVQKLEARATPDAEVSERLLRVVSPLLAGDESEHTMNLLGTVAMFAWNASWRPPVERARYLREAARKIAADNEAEAFLRMVDMILPHKMEMFPEDERIISDVRVEWKDGRYVFTAMVPPDFADPGPD